MALKLAVRCAACRSYMAIMTYFGLENKGGHKVPNKIGAFEVMRSFTATERVRTCKPASKGAFFASAPPHSLRGHCP